MIVLFETTWLAPGQAQSACNVRVNGRQIVDDAAFFRAATQTYFPRGNLQLEFSFETNWIFNTTALSEAFVMQHLSQLPMTNQDNGVLQVTCGEETTPSTIYSSSAVLASAEIVEYIGLSVKVRYTLLCQPFTSSVPANIPAYPNPNELVLVYRRGSILIPALSTTLAILFSSPFNTTPGSVLVGVSGPTGSSVFDAWAEQDTINVNGFTAVFNVAAPDSLHYLNYWAIQ